MSGLFGSKTPAPVAVPVIAAPTVMPTPMADDEATKKAKKKSLLAQKGRAGRASTILSTEDKLG